MRMTFSRLLARARCRSLLLPLAGLLVSACGADEPRIRIETREDGTILCLVPESDGVTILALAGACGCTGIRTFSCSTEFSEDRLVVSSRLMTSEDTQAEICTTGCEMRSAVCEADLPSEGAFELVHGAEQASVRLPLSAPLQLFVRSAPDLPTPDFCGPIAEAREASAALDRDADL